MVCNVQYLFKVLQGGKLATVVMGNQCSYKPTAKSKEFSCTFTFVLACHLAVAFSGKVLACTVKTIGQFVLFNGLRLAATSSLGYMYLVQCLVFFYNRCIDSFLKPPSAFFFL